MYNQNNLLLSGLLECEFLLQYMRHLFCNAKHKGTQTCPFKPLCYWASQIIFTPIISADETGMQSQLLLNGWCESEVDFEEKKD
jgi:hypothetical protein